MEFLPSAASALRNGSNFQRRLPICFRLLAIGLGALNTWAAACNHSMNADGISYLDIGDAYFGGDWNGAINSVSAGWHRVGRSNYFIYLLDR